MICAYMMLECTTILSDCQPCRLEVASEGQKERVESTLETLLLLNAKCADICSPNAGNSGTAGLSRPVDVLPVSC